jgi:hypothetical protein
MICSDKGIEFNLLVRNSTAESHYRNKWFFVSLNCQDRVTRESLTFR